MKSTISFVAALLATVSCANAQERPMDEVNFIMAVLPKRQFAAGANDMQKGASRPTRALEICAALPSFQIQNWVGTIEELTSNGESKGVVKIKIDEDVFVTTWNNALSDIRDGTLIEPASPLFNKVSVLEKGEKILFSGSFFPNKTDCVKESSLTLEGSITSPEFIMKFSEIDGSSAQASPAPIKKITPNTSTRPGTLAAPPLQPSTAQSTMPPYFKIKDECYTGLEPIVSDSSSLRGDIELCAKSETAFSEYLTHAWSYIPDDRKSYCTQEAQLRDFHGVQYFVIGLCVKEQIDDETLRGEMPPPSGVEGILRIHQIVIRYAHDRGETPQEFAERVHTSLKDIEASVYATEKVGGTPDDVLGSLERFSEALKDPEKQKLIECLGVKVFEDPQPIGHPPSAAECEQLEQKLGLPPAAKNSAPAAPAPAAPVPAAPAPAPPSVPAYVYMPSSTPVLHVPPRAIRERLIRNGKRLQKILANSEKFKSRVQLCQPFK